MTKKSESNPKSYVSSSDTYVEKQYFHAGEPFVTDEPKGKDWEEVTPAEVHQIEASTEKVPNDPPLEGLSVEALKAVAVTKNVNVTDLNTKDKLITAIKAANEPRL